MPTGAVVNATDRVVTAVHLTASSCSIRTPSSVLQIMNPLIRRRLPPSVRSLLTNTGPKEEEWTDTEPETVTRDGILLPSRGLASGQEDFLSPAKTREEKATEAGTNTRRNAVCTMCKCKPSCYTCPRCNIHYCGLACYQSPEHSVCSEEFYKESVLRELKEMGKSETEGRKKMQEILLGLRQKAESTHGGMERLLKEVGIVGDDTDEGEREATEKVQVMELLSRLAELQQSGQGNATGFEDILRKLEEIGGGELLPRDTAEDFESKEEEELDLADRLSGLDIDKFSEDELWELLDNKEKEIFIGLMKGGALGGLVPIWKPWWEEHDQDRKSLVEVLEEEAGKLERETTTVKNEQGCNNTVKTLIEGVEKKKNVKERIRKKKRADKGSSSVEKVPPISSKIPRLSNLCANPSPLVCYSLVNALYGYAFTLCRLNGDTDSLKFEFCDVIIALSEALNSNRVFSSVQEALDCGEALILIGGYFDRDDPQAPARSVEAVAHIMTGRDRQDATGYCLAALSQLRSVLSEARRTMSKEGEEGVKRQKYFLASKKCEFFQAWLLDNSRQIHRLAIELWSEHSRRESVRKGMEKSKVEENFKKGKGKGNSKLIEELN